MPFSTEDYAILDKVAHAANQGDQKGPELSSFYDRPVAWDEVLAYLAAKLTEISCGRYTVRRADSALFKYPSKGGGLHLVRCPGTTPEGYVTELTAGMKLMLVSGYRNGYGFDEEAASPEMVASTRAASEHRRRRKEAAQEAVAYGNAEADTTLQILREAARSQSNEEATQALNALKADSATIGQIAPICRMLGFSLSITMSDVMR